MDPRNINKASIDNNFILLLEQRLQQAAHLRQMEQEITHNIDRLLDIHSELVANIELLKETARQLQSLTANYQHQAPQTTPTFFRQLTPRITERPVENIQQSLDTIWLDMHARPFGLNFSNC